MFPIPSFEEGRWEDKQNMSGKGDSDEQPYTHIHPDRGCQFAERDTVIWPSIPSLDKNKIQFSMKGPRWNIVEEKRMKECDLK